VAKSKWRCLTPDCPNTEEHARGVCQPCYLSLVRRVNSGKTTWLKLVRLGLALPAKKPGRHASPMAKALKKAGI
jgi:hypothetical protein